MNPRKIGYSDTSKSFPLVVLRQHAGQVDSWAVRFQQAPKVSLYRELPIAGRNRPGCRYYPREREVVHRPYIRPGRIMRRGITLATSFGTKGRQRIW